MNGARLLLEGLVRQGVEVVFGHPGGAIIPVYDALVDTPLRHVLVRHEQAAALAADGYARATGRVGVCMATSGPGATNLVTGIANAHMDSVPLVAITGQVPSGLIGTDAFQEVDIVGMTLSVVKHSFAVRRVDEIADVVRDAFAIASSGRPGPVLIDLPKDVATAPTALRPHGPAERHPPQPPERESIAAARRLLARAERPLVYAGGGIGMARALEPFRRFVDQTGIVVVCTLKGLGCLPADHPHLLGMLGMHGTKAANFAVQQADVLLCVGARFDDRATGRLSGFAPGAAVIHLDTDPAEIDKLRRADVPLLGDMRGGLEALSMPLRIDGWRRRCSAWRTEHAWRYDRPGPAVYAPRLLSILGRRAAGEAIVTCDVGQHQMWVAQHFPVDRPERHLSSAGLGTMGFGLPAAVGAQLGCPGRTVVAVTGDGSFMMNVQELATIRRYALPIKIVLIDNGMLGMVRQWQELFFDRRYSEVELWDNPDFVAVAESFGIPGFRVERADEEAEAVRRIFASAGPILAHVRIDPEANVWPQVRPGATNEEMLEEER